MIEYLKKYETKRYREIDYRVGEVGVDFLSALVLYRIFQLRTTFSASRHAPPNNLRTQCNP